MRIKDLDVIHLRIPFDDGGSGVGMMPSKWNELDVVLVRIESESGLVGWGESFANFCALSVRASLLEQMRPMVVGADIDDPIAFNRAANRTMYGFGRYGIGSFALSGVDIALWDLKAKHEGVALHELWGGRKRDVVPAYASMVRYGDEKVVIDTALRAEAEGFSCVKLHEIDMDIIGATRKALKDSTDISIDVNCQWSLEQTQSYLPRLQEWNVAWLEEPIFPPEDFETLSSLRGTVPIAAGENVSTEVEAARLSASVDFAQPSIQKVGGPSVMLGMMAGPAKMLPHTPFFGPGLSAGVHLGAAYPEISLLEYLYIEPEVRAASAPLVPVDGLLAVPTSPGLGFELDASVAEKYAV